MVADFLHPPDTEFASMKDDNKALTEKVSKLEAEAAHWKAAAEEAKCAGVRLAEEVSSGKRAAEKLEKELDSMAGRLEMIRLEREAVRADWNKAVKRTADVEMSLTTARDKARRARSRASEIRKAAFAKMAEAQRTVNEFRVLKYLEGYEDGAAQVPKKHSVDELAANDDDDVSEGEDTDESSSVGSIGSDSGEDTGPAPAGEEAAVGQSQVAGGSVPLSGAAGTPSEKHSALDVNFPPGASAGVEKGPSSSAATTVEASVLPTSNVSEE